MTKGNKPDFLAKAKQSKESEFFNIIGAAWRWKQGDGLVVKLQTIPVGDWDGSFILTPPRDDDPS